MGLSLQDVDDDLKRVVSGLFCSPIRVLEAGGGSRFKFDVPPGSQITVVDISAEQLARNTYASTKILGDIQTVDLPPESFDLIIFRNVLEHLDKPAMALGHAISALRPGGYVVVAGPIVSSLRGLVTKLTPHVLHVAFFRYVLKWPNAGKPGFAPFPSYNRWFSHPRKLKTYLSQMGFSEIAYVEFEGEHGRELAAKSTILFLLYRLASAGVLLLTFGRLGHLESDFRLVAKKAGAVIPDADRAETGDQLLNITLLG